MKHFQMYELVDRTTYVKWGDRCITLFSPDLLFSLDGIREFFNTSVVINNWYGGGPFQYRGYRDPECTVGAEHSYHKKGMAADFDVKGLDADIVRGMIVEHQDDPLLAKIQRLEANVRWVHVDVGEVPKGKERIYLFKG